MSTAFDGGRDARQDVLRVGEGAMVSRQMNEDGLPFLRESEMAERLRVLDWSTTALGPIEIWPASLRAAVGICLNSRFPMFVWWGAELINVYNDAYVPVLGKRHPHALGRPARHIWADIWPVIGEDVERVIQLGEPVYKERVRLMMERNGFLEETYFTYSHSPIPDDEGGIGGLFQVCLDETRAVLAERGRETEAEQRRQADNRARTILESITDAFFSLDRQWRFSYLNGHAERLLDRMHGELLGSVIWDEYPGLEGSEFERAFRRAAVEGVATTATAFYADHQRWYEVHAYPSPDGVSIYFRDVSERRRAEEERVRLSADAARQARVFDTTLSSITDFAYIFDRDGRFVYVNKALLDLWGIGLEEAVGKNFSDLNYPDDLASKLARQVQHVFEHAERLSDETPYTSPTGVSGYYEYIFAPVLAADGTVEAVAGSTRDITDRKKLEIEREQLLRSLEVERSNLAAVIDQAPAFICTLRGPEHVFELANGRYYELIGRRDLIGKSVREALPEVVEQGFLRLLDDVYRTGEPFVGNEVPVRLRPGRDDGVDHRVINFVYQAVHAPDGRVSGIFVHGVDVTDLVRSREAVRESEERLRLGLEAGNTGTWDWDIAGDRIHWSERLYDLHGLTPQTFGGRFADFERLVHPDDASRVAGAIQGALEGCSDFRSEFRILRPGGQVRWITSSGRAYCDGSGKAVRMLGASSNITDRVRMAEDRERLLVSERDARAEAERVGRMKDEFLATLGHELRTPLNAILGWAQMLGRESTGPDITKQGLDSIERNARAQARLIEDLLDVSRIVSGRVRLDVQSVDLCGVVEAALDVVRPTADAKSIRLQCTADPRAASIFGDPSRLQQVLWNLLSNAIKFTPKGGRVHVVIQRVDSHVEISVSDSGQGIASEFLPHVFDRFAQADATTTRRHGGLGLGLSIVKNLVEMHGGAVWAESPGVGRGSTFIVDLPIACARAGVADRRSGTQTADHSVVTMASEVEGPHLEGVRVLVVDDEPDARVLVRHILEQRGAMVVDAGGADRALEMAERERPNLIVSDIGMPEVDGLSFIRELRARPAARGGRTPAIALTAFARSEDRREALKAGYQVHMPKPVEPEELVAVCAGLVGLTRRD